MTTKGEGCAWAALAISVVAVGSLASVMLVCGGLIYLGSQGRPSSFGQPDKIVNTRPAPIAPALAVGAEKADPSIPEIAPALTGFRGEHPQAVCRYIEREGHETGTYRPELGNEGVYATCSPYRDIGKGINPNHIAYYVEGDKDSVSELKLVLVVFQRPEAASAHGELLATGSVLIDKATGHPMPPQIKEAIEKGKDGIGAAGTAVVNLIREDFPTGKGYSLSLTIQ